MRWWPFGSRKVETRQSQGGAGYTDAVVRALLETAAGGVVADPAATAALEAAAGVYARAFAVAEVQPMTASTAALTAPCLALMARDLIRRGEHVAAIEVDGSGMVRLRPAASWDVTGGDDESSWTYRVDLFGPSANRTVRLPASGVVHARYSVDGARPWQGIGPLAWARLTGRLHAEVEAALGDEASGTRGHVLPMPAGPETDEVDADGNPVDPQADLRRDVANLRGKTVLVETTAAGWGEGTGAAPRHDWQPQRLGAAPPAPLVDLRSESARSVLAACGVPAALFEAGGDAAGKRESWRILLHGAVQPVADLLAVELGAKLDAPGLRLGFDRLFASDLQGRARAFQSLTGGGMAADRAAELAGLS